MNFTVIGFEASGLMSRIIHKLSTQDIVYDRCFVVPHSKKDFADALKLSLTADNIIVIGGLGQNSRSFVKETLAEALGIQLVKNQKAEENLTAFALGKKSYTKQQFNQLVSYPEGFDCYPVPAENSSAHMVFGGKEIYLINEDEGERVFDAFIYNQILKKRGYVNKQHCFKLYGLSKPEIAERATFKRTRTLSFDILSSPTRDSLVTISFGHRVKDDVIADVTRDFCTVFAEEIYADSDIALEAQAVNLLTVRGRTISLAESVTGGLIASKLISVSGASKVINEAFVCYSNQSKITQLGVSTITLSKQGAVSDETAYEMAVGLLNKKSCNLALATTGIADYGGEATSKPVGLCYTSIGDERGVHVHKNLYGGTRNQIREQASSDALFRIIKHIYKN